MSLGTGLVLSFSSPLLIVGLILGGLLAWLAGRFFAPTPSRGHHRVGPMGRDALSLAVQPGSKSPDLELLRMATDQVRGRLGRARSNNADDLHELRRLRDLDRRLRRSRWILRWRSLVVWAVHRRRRRDAGEGAGVRPSTARILSEVDTMLRDEGA